MDLPPKERAASLMKRAAPWLGALAGHAALALTVGMADFEAQATLTADPPALIVTLIQEFPEPSPPSPPPADGEAAETEAQEPDFDFSTHIADALGPPLDELEVLSSPSSTVAVGAVSPAIRDALARTQACVAASQTANSEQRAPCPPMHLALGGPAGAAFLDASVLEERGAAAVWTRVTTFVSSRVLSMTEGVTIPETTWGANARANPLVVDQNIFDAESGEITITRPADAPR